MTNQPVRICDELRRGYDGDCWHGPPLMEVLKGVTAKMAAAKYKHLTHSIWELVNHLALWIEIVTRRTLESQPIGDAETGDFASPGSISDEAWQETLADLDRKHRKLLEVIDQLDETQLDRIVPGKAYPVAVMMHGTSQHYAYHGGQIALMRKLDGAVPLKTIRGVIRQQAPCGADRKKSRQPASLGMRIDCKQRRSPSLRSAGRRRGALAADRQINRQRGSGSVAGVALVKAPTVRTSPPQKRTATCGTAARIRKIVVLYQWGKESATGRIVPTPARPLSATKHIWRQNRPL